LRSVKLSRSRCCHFGQETIAQLSEDLKQLQERHSESQNKQCDECLKLTLALHQVHTLYVSDSLTRRSSVDQQAADDFGLDLETYRDLQILRRSIFCQLFENLSQEMRKTKDRKTIMTLTTQRKLLNYDPVKDPLACHLLKNEEIPLTSRELLLQLEEKEREYLMSGEMKTSELYDQCKSYLLSLLQQIHFHFDQEYAAIAPPTIVSFDSFPTQLFPSPFTTTPPPPPPPLNPLASDQRTIQMAYRHGGMLLEDVQSVSLGRIYRGYSPIIQKEVIVKVDNEYHDLDREVQILRQLGRDPVSAVTFLEHVISSSSSSSSTDSTSRPTHIPDYMILRSFGEPWTAYFTSNDHRRPIGTATGAAASCGSSFDILQLEEIIHAVDWLHSLSIVHCDLKPENILVCDKGRGSVAVKLCDFENAVRVDEAWKIYPPSQGQGSSKTRGHGLKFSPDWVSPEVYLFNSELMNLGTGETSLPLSLSVSLFATLSLSLSLSLSLPLSHLHLFRFFDPNHFACSSGDGSLLSGSCHQLLLG
jgi:hypothetical protein